MGGGGTNAPTAVAGTNQESNILSNRSRMSSDPKIASILADYGSGKISLQDAMAAGKSASTPQQKTYTDADASAYADSKMDAAKADWASKHPGQSVANAPEAELRGSLSREYQHNLDAQNATNTAGTEGDENAFMQLLTTDPMAAQRYGTDEIRTNALTKGLFGDGGMQDQVQKEASGLIGTTADDSNQYQGLLDEIKGGDWQKLTPEDNSAYGVMSGNIARQYGSQENDLAQSLADRGLASAPSGAAGVGFSGIQGNKMEQLANAQRQVLQDRVNTAMQTFQMRNQALGQKSNFDQSRLDSARGTATNLGALGQTALSNLFSRNMAGRNATEQELANSAGITLNNQKAYQDQLNQQFSQQQASKGPGFGDIAGALAGGAAGAFTGGLGTSAGAALGGSLFGGGKKAQDPRVSANV